MVRFPPGRVSWLCVSILVIGAVTATAGPLENARKAVDDVDYPAAQAALDEALASGKYGPEDLVEIYRLRGMVAATLGDTKGAVEAFKRLLALSPKATLPAGTSPKISRPFATAGEFYKSHKPLEVKADTAAAPPRATLVIESDPLTLVVKARVVFVVDGKPELTLEASGTGSISIELPQGKRIDLRIEALDHQGNRLVELGSKDVPLVIVGGEVTVDKGKGGPHPPRAERPYHPRPWYFRWWAWTGGAVLFGAGTTYMGVQAHSAIEDLRAVGANSIVHPFHDATDIESRMQRDVLLFNIGLGITGALALGATILYLTDPHKPAEHPRATHLTPVPVPGGGALVVGGAF